MKYSQSEEQLNNLVFISMNKGHLKKMKVEHRANTFYDKLINKFIKKKRIEWIY